MIKWHCEYKLISTQTKEEGKIGAKSKVSSLIAKQNPQKKFQSVPIH